MTHDFAKQRAARANRASKPAPPPWLWLVSGVVLGTLLSFLVYLATLAPQPSPLTPAITTAEPEVPAQTKETAKPTEKPQFDFYTILPESEVIVADRPVETPAEKPVEPAPKKDTKDEQAGAGKAPAETPAAKPVEVPEPTVLLLQAGSFRTQNDAARRRADIILLGYPARVETVTARGGETWHRVQVGPFASARALGEARGALRDQGIETLEIGKRA